MPRATALLLAAILISATAGCGPAENSEDQGRTTADKTQALQGSSFGPMVGTMDRARNVELLQQARKEELDAAMQASEDR